MRTNAQTQTHRQTHAQNIFEPYLYFRWMSASLVAATMQMEQVIKRISSERVTEKFKVTLIKLHLTFPFPSRTYKRWSLWEEVNVNLQESSFSDERCLDNFWVKFCFWAFSVNGLQYMLQCFWLLKSFRFISKRCSWLWHFRNYFKLFNIFFILCLKCYSSVLYLS